MADEKTEKAAMDEKMKTLLVLAQRAKAALQEPPWWKFWKWL